IEALGFPGSIKPVRRVIGDEREEFDTAKELCFHCHGWSGSERDFQRCEVMLQTGAPVSMSSTRSARVCRSPVARSSKGFFLSNSELGIRNHFRNPSLD